MQRVAFTERKVRDFPAPAKGRVYVHDERTPHLALCVTAAGAKTWYRTGRVAGRPVRIRLGTAEELSVDAARRACAELTGKVAGGHDPTARKRDRTLGELWAWYFEHHSKPHKSTWQADERRWARVWSSWAKRPLSAVTTDAVQQRVTEVRAASGPYAGNKARELLRHMFAVAVRIGWTQANPATSVPRFKTRSRERFLRPDEMARFFAALDESPRHFQDYVLLCLFTGARRGNVGAMRWAHLDLAVGTWGVPGDESKNREPMNVILPTAAVALLSRRRLLCKGSPFVFPSRSACGHYLWPKTAWTTLLLRAGLATKEGDQVKTTLRLHDLRRTLGSWQANAGVPLNVIGDSLGHKSLSATQIYARLQRDSVRSAVENATAAMIRAASPDPPEKKSKTH